MDVSSQVKKPASFSPLILILLSFLINTNAEQFLFVRWGGGVSWQTSWFFGWCPRRNLRLESSENMSSCHKVGSKPNSKAGIWVAINICINLSALKTLRIFYLYEMPLHLNVRCPLQYFLRNAQSFLKKLVIWSLLTPRWKVNLWGQNGVWMKLNLIFK